MNGINNISDAFSMRQNAASQTTAAADTAAKTKSESGGDSEKAKEKSLIDNIRDKGFMTYVKELADKKQEELRKKILDEMGFTLEDLAKMSPEQRARIEKIVNAEVLKRMTAESEISNNLKEPLGLHNSIASQVGQPVNAKIDSNGVGIGPLLALQESDQIKNGEDPKKEPVFG